MKVLIAIALALTNATTTNQKALEPAPPPTIEEIRKMEAFIKSKQLDRRKHYGR